RRNAAQLRAARCQARTDGPEHLSIAGRSAGHQKEDIIPACGPNDLRPVTQTTEDPRELIACGVSAGVSAATRSPITPAIALGVALGVQSADLLLPLRGAPSFVSSGGTP